MKIIIPLLISLCYSSLAKAQEFEMQEGDTTYVMKKYYLCLLLSGDNRDQDSTAAAQIQMAHLAHMDSLAINGKLHIAGPMDEEGELRGISILDAGSKEEAYQLAANDPAVRAGRLKVVIHPWWAAKGSTLK